MTTTASSDPISTPALPTGQGKAEPGQDLSKNLPHTPAHDAGVPRPPGSGLGPDESFPEHREGLDMTELQVLHSRITRQLDHDYLTDPLGPHPTTSDRQQELLTELDARDAG